MPKVGKKHISCTPAGRKKATAYAEKLRVRVQEVGTVGALDAKRKRERDTTDFLSAGKRSTQRQANVGFETKAQRDANALRLRQQQATGKMGGGATNLLVKRRLGIAAGTEMNWKDKLVEMEESTSSSDSAEDRLKDTLATDLRHANWAAKGSQTTPERIRQSQQAASILKAMVGKHRKTKVRSRRHASQSDTGKHIKPANIDRAPKPGATHAVPRKIAASTELDWTHKLVEQLVVEKDWIQGAVNPAHKGFCTPMSAKTCTPAREALARRFKRAGRKEKRSGGTGWEGKV